EKRVKDAKSDAERAHAQSDLNAVMGLLQFANSTVLGLPNYPLDPAKMPLSVDLGGLQAVLESYPGHSGTDIVTKIADQNVVYTGDLLFSGWYPVCFDEKASVSAWRETLKKFASFDKDTLFVPGHGQLCGREGISSIREVFDDVAGQAEKMCKAGVPWESAAPLHGARQIQEFPHLRLGFRHRSGYHQVARRMAGKIAVKPYLGKMPLKSRITCAEPRSAASVSWRSHNSACMPAALAASISLAASDKNKNCLGSSETAAAIFR